MCVGVQHWEQGSPECGCRLMGAIISMPKTLSDEESLPGDRHRPINLQHSGHLPRSEPTYGLCLCCRHGSSGGGGISELYGEVGKRRSLSGMAKMFGTLETHILRAVMCSKYLVCALSAL